jgi:hypothetical protein
VLTAPPKVSSVGGDEDVSERETGITLDVKPA